MPGLNFVDGLNSGLPTGDIIDQIMSIERRPAVLLEIQQADKTNIITALKALQAKFLAMGTSLGTLARTSTFEATKIDISDNSFLTASAEGRVGAGTYDIQVLSLARNHQLASQGFADEFTASFGTGTITLALGDGSSTDITIDASNNSLIGIKQAINDANLDVTASIINDGSSSNPYRLILTADKTGAKNRISVTSSLTGGSNLNYSTASFDTPETLSWSSGSTSTLSLGASAAYTGSTNKIYSFTVQGTGTQIVGTDIIAIDWSDGTDSGTINVTQADTEVSVGSEGLKLSFSAGDLVAGDTFQTSTFAPLLQDAADARIALGSSGGSGSPIIITSETNTIQDAIGGLTLTLKKETADGESITLSTDRDISRIKANIKTFINRYNDINKFIDEQNTYKKDEGTSGVLFGNLTVMTMQRQIQSAVGSVVTGLDSKFSRLGSIGIRTQASGKLAIVDSAALEDALRNNLDEVINLFTASATSSSSYIDFVALTDDTKVGDNYDVDITQAATPGTLAGTSLTDPATTAITLDSTNNKIKLKVDGLVSNDIVLTAKTYNSSSELITELKAKIEADTIIGDRKLAIEWVDEGGGTGYVLITSSGYGSSSKVEIESSVSDSAYSSLGLASAVSAVGLDVEGTINGEAATGIGQLLTGDSGNATTDGLRLRVTLMAAQLGAGAEGTISTVRGVASKMGTIVGSLTRGTDGTFDMRIKGYQNQVEDLSERIEKIDERLALRRESLFKKWYEMEVALGRLNSVSSFLTSQLGSLNTNWRSLGSN